MKGDTRTNHIRKGIGRRILTKRGRGWLRETTSERLWINVVETEGVEEVAKKDGNSLGTPCYRPVNPQHSSRYAGFL